MIDEIKLLSQLVDIPITVGLVVWTLKMLERKEKMTEQLLRDCIEDALEDRDNPS